MRLRGQECSRVVGSTLLSAPRLHGQISSNLWNQKHLRVGKTTNRKSFLMKIGNKRKANWFGFKHSGNI